VTFNGWRMTPQGKGMLDLTVRRGDDIFNATPMLYYNQRMGATMATPSIKSELFRDVYVSPVEYLPANDPNLADLTVEGTREVGPYKLTFLGFDAAELLGGSAGDIGAKLRVTYQGQETVLTPKLRVVANETDPAKAFQEMPVALPGGQTASLLTFDPMQRRVIIRVNGLNLPIDPAKAVVTVSIKPGIILVWTGIVIGVLGGLIALLRRTLEGMGGLGSRRSRLPRGLGELVRGAGSLISRARLVE
jgi:cytochrome c-type biogenesis protein CcmF